VLFSHTAADVFNYRSKVILLTVKELSGLWVVLGNAQLPNCITLPITIAAFIWLPSLRNRWLCWNLKHYWMTLPNWLLSPAGHVKPVLSGYPPWLCRKPGNCLPHQQLNLDLIGGVSFRKGCYPGLGSGSHAAFLAKPNVVYLMLVANIKSIPAVVKRFNDIEGAVIRSYRSSHSRSWSQFFPAVKL